MLIFSIAYWPNIEYFARIIGEKKIYIEKKENFIKQTYRNRCEILSPIAKMNLIVPVLGGRSMNKKPIDQIKIDYTKTWIPTHLNSLKTAYGSAPFFDFYFDQIKSLLKLKPYTLFSLDLLTINLSLQLLQVQVEIKFTNNFIKLINGNNDYRYKISPKIKSELKFPPYPQVFEDRFGFVPNLSILDLLFNLGPEALSYLKSIRV